MIIPSVELPSVGDSGLVSEDIKTLTNRLAVLPEIFLCGSGDSVSGVNAAKPYKSLLWTCDCRVGPFDVLTEDHEESTTKTVVAWLDSGARRAILKVDVSKRDSVRDLADWTRQLPSCRHRLVAAIQAGDLRAREGGIVEEALRTAMEGLRPVVGCVQVDFGVNDYDLAPKILSELKSFRGREGASDYVELVFTRSNAAKATNGSVAPVGARDVNTPTWSPEEIGRLHQEFSVDVQCSASLELSKSVNSKGEVGSAVDAAGAFLACVRTDRPDGLMTTVVCDTTGIALGLVYSNPVSVRASLESSRGIYWSRSRGGLWRKGDTSGAWQELRRLSLDCDSDALRFTVVQHGDPPAFCHFNRRNCWESERGLGHLERTLAKRKEEAPEGSYTKRLFEDPGLLRNKLVEEAQELAEASTKKHIAEEAADVTYFMMVRCAAAGVSVEDIEKELDMRALKLKRRPGNAKTERIAAGDQILGAGRQTSVAKVV